MLCKRDFLDIKTELQEAVTIFPYQAAESMSRIIFYDNE